MRGRGGLIAGHFSRFKYGPDANQRVGDREHDAEYKQYLKDMAKANKKSEDSPGCFCFGWFKKKDHNPLSDSENETFIELNKNKVQGSGFSRL